jgi:ATP-dependent DNA ligase
VPDLQFVPFDCIPWDYNETTEGPEVYLGQCDGVLYGAPYSARIKSLQNRKSIVTSVRCPLFLTVEAGKLIAMATTQALHYKALGGYDGVVAAKLSGRYVVGAGKGGEFIKFKPLMSESLRVVAVEPAIGIKTGKNTCALVVVYKDQPQRVSTGLTQAEVNEYVNFPASIIGKTVEVEAMGVTVTGLLREPRYKGIRNDVI